MKDLRQLLSSLQYWEGISECECASTTPSGGCLKCDMQAGIKLLSELAERVPTAEGFRGTRLGTQERVYGDLIRNGGRPYIVNGVIEATDEYIILGDWTPVEPESVKKGEEG